MLGSGLGPGAGSQVENAHRSLHKGYMARVRNKYMGIVRAVDHLKSESIAVLLPALKYLQSVQCTTGAEAIPCYHPRG